MKMGMQLMAKPKSVQVTKNAQLEPGLQGAHFEVQEMKQDAWQ